MCNWARQPAILTVYDRDSGQLLTGTLLDHGIPRADTMSAINVDFSPVPSTMNPLGSKGVGEGGTVASTPMPATPERTCRVIRRDTA